MEACSERTGGRGNFSLTMKLNYPTVTLLIIFKFINIRAVVILVFKEARWSSVRPNNAGFHSGFGECGSLMNHPHSDVIIHFEGCGFVCRRTFKSK